jgi:Ca2+ transporting ATPase
VIFILPFYIKYLFLCK